MAVKPPKNEYTFLSRDTVRVYAAAAAHGLAHEPNRATMAVMISRDDIAQLAALARLRLTDEEVRRLQGEMASILEYVSELRTLKTGDVEHHLGDVYNVMRGDAVEHEPGAYTDAILENAPQREGEYFKVKKIIDYE